MKSMSHPTGQGRILTKDIDYTVPGKRVKDYGVKASKLPVTAGMEVVTSTPRPKHDIVVENVK